jgi:Fic family protein
MSFFMKHLKDFLKENREKKGLLIREVAHAMHIDSALVSRYEKGERLPPQSSLQKFAETLDITESVLTKYWLADKILEQIKPYAEAKDAIALVEEGMLEYKKAVKAPLSSSLKKILAEADDLKKEIRKHHPLNNSQLNKLNEYFNTNYTYESNRIEGNTLSLQETALVVNKGITISGKSMKEHLEAINHAEALEYIQDLAKGKTLISEKLIKELHFLILKTIDKENAGRFRLSDVRITGSKHVPASHYDIPLEMNKLLQYYNVQKNNLHPVLLAADMHWMLAGIHPFIDGNGRTSRLLMNLLLINKGYVIANVKGDITSRQEYYKSLETAQVNLNTTSFRSLIAQTVVDGLREYNSLLGTAKSKKVTVKK